MAARGILSGKTVLVTRPRRLAAGLSRRLRRLGARVLAAPAIRTVNPVSWAGMDRALKRLESYDSLVFTSANGVSQFFKRAAKILKTLPQRPRRLYAIGPETARALRRFGWSGIGVPDRYEGEALARRLGRARGRRILIPRAEKARDVLPKSLRSRGAMADVVEAYRTVGDAAGLRLIRKAVEKRAADVVTFTSSSTVEHFMRAAPRARLRRFFKRAIAASIGPITSSALRRHGVRRIVEAKTFTSAGLVRAVAGAFSHGKR